MSVSDSGTDASMRRRVNATARRQMAGATISARKPAQRKPRLKNRMDSITRQSDGYQGRSLWPSICHGLIAGIQRPRQRLRLNLKRARQPGAPRSRRSERIPGRRFRELQIADVDAEPRTDTG